MATNFLTLVSGIPRMQAVPGTTAIYDQSVSVVAGTPGANQIQGPVTAGTNITLPASGTYQGAELNVFLNGDRLEPVFDYSYVGTGAKTQITMTFGLVTGDRLDFRMDRGL